MVARAARAWRLERRGDRRRGHGDPRARGGDPGAGWRGPRPEAGEAEGGGRGAAAADAPAAVAAAALAPEGEDTPGVVTRVREPRKERDEPQSVKGSTRLEAKKQRRREGREAGRRRTIITEAEFLARRESVERTMVVRERDGRTQIGVLEDDVLVEHYVSRETNASGWPATSTSAGSNVLPSMEAAFVDIGKGRNAVLYAGEVNWDAAGLENNQPKRIENALKSGDTVLVQVTKDPIGHKGARSTSQISPGRYLVYVPEGSMTGISQAPRHRARPPEADPQGGRARERGRHRADRRRGGQRGGAARRRRAPHQDLGADQVQGRLQVRLEGQVRRRACTRPRRAGPHRPGHPRRLQRGLHPPSSSPATRRGPRSASTSTTSPPTSPSD